MVAISDVMSAQSGGRRAMFTQADAMSGNRWLARGAQKFGGAALVLAAFGLWAHPSAAFDQDVLLFKLVLSIVMGMAVCAMIVGGQPERAVEIEIDADAGELRLVRAPNGETAEVLHRCAFTDMGQVELVGQMVRLWDADSGLLAEVPLVDAHSRTALFAALKAHGKL